MTASDFIPATPGQTTFYQGEAQDQPLFRIEAGIPCWHAREQVSELLGCVCDLTLSGIMDESLNGSGLPTTSARLPRLC